MRVIIWVWATRHVEFIVGL